jgi:hypothetical protein
VRFEILCLESRGGRFCPATPIAGFELTFERIEPTLERQVTADAQSQRGAAQCPTRIADDPTYDEPGDD